MQGSYAYVDSTIRRAFEDIDTDGSGKLSQRELSMALQRLGMQVRSEAELYGHMERYDQDEDGRLNLHEFARMIEQMRAGQNQGPSHGHAQSTQPGRTYYEREAAHDPSRSRATMSHSHGHGSRPQCRGNGRTGDGIYVAAGRLRADEALRRHAWVEEVWVDIDVMGVENLQTDALRCDGGGTDFEFAHTVSAPRGSSTFRTAQQAMHGRRDGGSDVVFALKGRAQA